MKNEDQIKVEELVKTNYYSKRKIDIKGERRHCSCSGCECPGGEVGPVSASVIGYAGGYAGDLSV